MSAIQQIAMALAVAGIGAGQGLAQEGAGAARRAAARMEEQAQASMLLLGQARQQYSEGKYQEALDNYRRSLTALPKSPNMEKRAAVSWKPASRMPVWLWPRNISRRGVTMRPSSCWKMP